TASSPRNNMPICIAMLRGINVSGHKIIRMEQLRASFEDLGFRDVRTYVQSGNVVFDSGKNSTAGLSAKIEKKILTDYGFDVPVLLKTAEELERVIHDNPLAKAANLDESRLHITFLSDAAPKTAEKSLQALAASSERFHVNGREIYLYCPDGYGRTKLSNTAIEKKLGLGATTRNWKSVNALLALAQGSA
ncbi:MAG TPA: DUF1697 domain-containing protein, partial [Verrucomicrobiae bacterium]|nr:DUF1697 domain-containing protein [Verrucomicrobiae bacterium]